jgi:PAS domain S-box-containing protein
VKLSDGRSISFTPQRREEFKSLLSKHGIVSGFEHQIFHEDGSKLWVSLNARAVRDGKGQIVYYEGTVQDITERKRTEAALRESEELFSRAFHSSPAPLIITRLADGLFLNANDAFLRAFEYERAEVIGQSVATLNIYVGPGDREHLVSTLQDLGTLQEYESRARTKSGRILDLLVFVEPVTLNGEQCLLSTAYDITDRKQVEVALRESEERYRELFENAKDAIYVHDLSGRYTSVNRAAEELSGYSRAEIIGKHYSNFMAPRHLKHARKNLVKKLDEVPETTYEIDLITKDRRRVPVEVSSRLIYENGEPVGVQGTARDITERQLAEQARTQLALIVESSHDAIIGKTLDGTIVSWNSGAAKIYGYLAEEVIGRSVSLLVPPERRDELPRIMGILRRGESIKHYETTRRTKGGNVIDVSLTISPIRDSLQNLVGASTIARDITSSKQAEKGLKTFSRRLIEAQEAERQSIARELHDEIGQVLTAVRINLQSIQRSGLADPNNPRFDESVAIVDEALGRVRDLSIELRPSLLDDLGLSAALRWYVDRYAQRTGIIAEVLNGFEEDGRLPRELETACFRIAQEALTNVARHAQAGSVSVQLERSWDRMLLTVMDDGVGFDLDSMRKNTVAASALGLRGMEERALAVGGHIEIDSGSGHGTRVRASFPLRPD